MSPILHVPLLPEMIAEEKAGGAIYLHLSHHFGGKEGAMLRRMFEYYVNHPEALPEDFQPQLSFDGMERTVCDYIAGMTDNYAVDKYTELFIPAGWQVRG